MSLPLLVICMGVSGSGKSTLAKHLAEHLKIEYFDADDLHTLSSREKMAAGIGINDQERDTWMERVGDKLRARVKRGKSCVMAHSALRRHHRSELRQYGLQTIFLYLDVPAAVITERLMQRQGHFAATALLPSQYRALQRPVDEADVHIIDGGATFEVVRAQACALLKDIAIDH